MVVEPVEGSCEIAGPETMEALMATVRTWKCEVCGYVHEGPEPPDTCPVCGVEKDLFSPMEMVEEAPGLPQSEAWRCTVCGYVHEGSRPPELCPVCGVDAGLFEPVETTASATATLSGPHIVIVGGGVGGVVAAARAREASPHVRITLVVKEPGLPYYRLNLTRLLAGEVTEGDLPLHPKEWYTQRHIEILQGDCVGIDRKEREVLLRDDRRVPFDRLILANGSHPFVPPIPGVTREGVHPFRTLQDAKALLSLAGPGRRCVCVGGGLLGLEAAGALRKHGCEVVVLEGFGWLLPRQLAEPAGKMLQSHLESLGMEIRCNARIKELFGDEAVGGVRLEDGTEVVADFVVLATGVRPNSYLARQCGLEVEKGVLVNDRMETSDPSIYAVGDLAEHRGVLPGLWPFSYAHGAVAGANAAGGSAEFRGMPMSNQLKVLDVQMFSIGQFEATDGSYFVHEEKSKGRYWRFVCRDGALVGANLYGDASVSGLVREAVESGTQILELTELLKKVPALSAFGEVVTQ